MKAKHVSTTIALALGATALGSSSVAGAQTVAPPPPASPPPIAAQPPSAAAPPLLEPVPAVATETRPNRSMLMLSFVTLGGPYLASIGIAATSTHYGDANLWIPAVGPWLDLGARPPCPSSTDCGIENGYRGLLVANGVLQTFGLCQLIGAFLWPETVPVATFSARRGAYVSLAPAGVGARGYGVAAVGRFW
jgi:hypothetical protein